MRKGLGVILILGALIAVCSALAHVYSLNYWLLPAKEKFKTSWANDIKLLEESKKLPQAWSEIKDINVRTDNSPAQDWIVNFRSPIQTNPKGTFRLDIFIIHFIQNDRYGAVIQYNLVDLKNGNTVWELARTLKLGFIL